MVDIVNLQRKITVKPNDLHAFTAELISCVSEARDRRFSIAFVSNSRMKQLNEIFRGKKGTTDVLSFPHEPDQFDPDKTNLGDIVISAEQASKQAAENGFSLETEIRQLILHGLLHLCGYDHETDAGEMNARELDLRDQLGINR
jgi:probable rRNA maturation factor